MERIAAQIVDAEQSARRALLYYSLQLSGSVHRLPVQVRNDVIGRDVRAMQRRIPIDF
jgi:hypothetical protein